MYDKKASAKKISKIYIESKLFGLMKDTISNQDMSRIIDRLKWMFKKGQHKVLSHVDRTNTVKVIEVHSSNSVAKLEGVFVNPKGGLFYRNLVVDIDGTRAKVQNFDQAISLIYKHFSDLGLRS